MPIDPNIALSFKPSVALEDPMQQYGKAQQIQANAMAMRQARNENALAQQTAMAGQKTALEDQAVNKLYAQNFDPVTRRVDMNKVMEGAAQLGLGGRLPGMQKEQLETESKVQETEKNFAANVNSALKNSTFLLQAVRTPEQAMQYVDQIYEDPILKEYFRRLGKTPDQARAQIAAVANDPAAFADVLQKMQLGLEGSQKAIEAEANRGTQIELQGMIDQRMAANRAARPAAPARAVAGGGAPAAGTPAAAGKPATVSEQSAGYNIGRVLEAAKAIKGAVDRSPEADAPSAVEAAVGALPFTAKAVNFTRGGDRQIVAAAQRDMLDGLLYLATGAAYNKEQLAGQYESYITAFSDKPEARESKRQRLAQLVKNAKVRAGKAWTPELEKTLNDLFGKEDGAEPAASAPPAPSTPKVNQVVNGYRYMGGDPAKPSSWKKI
jgi:hypothetical protein